MSVIYTDHSIGNEQYGHSVEVRVSVHVAIRMLLALSQPENYNNAELAVRSRQTA